MSYNSNIPLGTDPMIKSQGQIRSNYQAIYTVFAENHVALNQANQGMHAFLNFRPQVASPDPTTDATQIALYTKIVGGTANLIYAPSSSQTPIQLTYNSLSTGLQSSDPDVYLPNQYSFIAGPFIVYGGIILGATVGFVKVLTPTSTLLYAGVTTVYKDKKSTASFCTISGSSITVNFSAPPATQDIYYLAIGKP